MTPIIQMSHQTHNSIKFNFNLEINSNPNMKCILNILNLGDFVFPRAEKLLGVAHHANNSFLTISKGSDILSK